MALIKCPECGKEISDSAERCPNCGCTTKAGKTRAEQKGLGFSGLLAIGFLIVGMILIFTGHFLFGLPLVVGGVVGMVSANSQIKEFNAKQEREKAIASGEIDLSVDKEWKCRCGKTNVPGLKNCYYCGQNRRNSQVR